MTVIGIKNRATILTFCVICALGVYTVPASTQIFISCRARGCTVAPKELSNQVGCVILIFEFRWHGVFICTVTCIGSFYVGFVFCSTEIKTIFAFATIRVTRTSRTCSHIDVINCLTYRQSVKYGITALRLLPQACSVCSAHRFFSTATRIVFPVETFGCLTCCLLLFKWFESQGTPFLRRCHVCVVFSTHEYI